MPESIHRLIEREAQRWELNRRHQWNPPEPPQARPVICISREFGAAGGTLARALGKKIGFEVYDRELLEAIRDEAHIREQVLQSVDEQTRGCFRDLVRDLFAGDTTAHWRYEEHLAELIMALAHHGNCILVGRGAAFLIPRNQTLSVRLVADREWRLRRVRDLQGLSDTEATTLMDQSDRLRNGFLQALSSQDPNDPHAYDLVLDSSSLPLSAQLEIVEVALHGKFLHTASAGRAAPRLAATAPR